MAQVRAADRAGTGDFEFAAALATASAGEFLVCRACVGRPHGDLRGMATALVSRLVPALVAAGILFEPAHRSLRAGGVFYFHPYAGRTGAAAGRQGFVATQTSARCEDILGSVQRLQSAGPAFLKLKF